MCASKIQIYNIALNILGISSPLENANIQDNKAILLNNYYEVAKEYVLKDFDWNFASSFTKLALVNYNIDFNQFQYCYNYPNDCICARDIFEKNSYVIQKFSIAAFNNNEKVILTNTKDAILRYTKRIDKEIYFTSEFVLALSYYLASLTSGVLTGSLQKGELAFEKYNKILKRAKLLNAQEGVEFIYNEDTYLDSRG